MRLNDPLINSFIYKGKEYTIDLAFDNVLDVFDVLDDEGLRTYEKAEICLALLLDDQEYSQNELMDLWDHIHENYIKRKAKEPVQYDLEGNPMPVNNDEEKEGFIDLEQDAEYIFASFKQAYNINLYKEQGSLHWHEFSALLNGLPSDTIIQRVIQIRLWKPSKGDTSEQRESMRKLQRIYALHD